ncbi:ATP-binding protein, partial [Shinella sp.]
PRLFEPFFSSKPDGMGLGLSLCESIVERFDGSISAENGAAGGAVFTVRLPAAEDVQKREEAAE